MAITRRQFIRRSGLATAGALLGPGLLGSPWLQRAVADTIGDRYLIVLFLDGGNDGLNTIIPVSGSGGLRTDYEAARNTGGSGLRIASPLIPSNAFSDPRTGDQLGFHPGLAAIRDMYDQGNVAVIQGCGYPEYSLSHDESRSIWKRGAPFGTPNAGWVGRYLALAEAGYTGMDIPAANLGGEVAGEYLQTKTSVLVFERLRDFGFPYDFSFDDDDDFDDTTFKKAAFGSLYDAATANAHPFMQYIGGTGTATQLAADAYPQCHTAYEADRHAWSIQYNNDQDPKGLNTSTSRRMREIAKVIYSVARDTSPNIKARHFHLSNGGYDTHSDQGGATGQHFDLHAEIGQALQLFYNDLADMSSGAPSGSGLQNLADKVVTVVYSEFSRRIFQNDNGTDHGSQGPVLVIGGGVNGGVYGDHPNIDESALDDDGNTVYKQDTSNGAKSTDLRDVYGTIIKHWLGVTNPASLAALLPDDTTFGHSGPNYWTVPSFNMGFLP
jgi:uncharacterized protein (DUF1501 family)